MNPSIDELRGPEDGGKPNRRHTYKKRYPFVVGKVHANWCGHCQSLKPEWSKMKGILKKKKPGIQYVEIEEQEIGKKFADVKRNYGVELTANGYPTLFKIEEGKLNYYNGERTAEQMADWYANSGKHNRDHYGIFRGGFQNLYEMRQKNRKTRKNRTLRKKSSSRSGLLDFLFRRKN